MSIKKLTKELEKAINEKMDQFSQLGKKAKAAQKVLDKHYLEMSEIVEELKPVEFLVRHQYPKHCDLFDVLLEFKEKKGKHV